MSVTPYDAFVQYNAAGGQLDMVRFAETIRQGDFDTVELVAIKYSGFSLAALCGQDMPEPNLIHALTPIVCRHADVSEPLPVAIRKHVQQTLPARIGQNLPAAILARTETIQNIYRRTDAKMAFYARDRILDLSEIFRTNVSVSWAYALDQLRRAQNQPPSHAIGTVIDFIRLMSDTRPLSEQMVSFQFSPGGRSIHLAKFRQVVATLCHDGPGFIMAACTIGLPLQNMYTPREFVKHWSKSIRRCVESVPNDFIVELALGHVFTDEVKTVRGTRAHQLKDIYEEHYARIRFQPPNNATLEQYVRDRFYRTPRPSELTSFAERIDANRVAWLGVPLRVARVPHIVTRGVTTPPPTRPVTPSGGESKGGESKVKAFQTSLMPAEAAPPTATAARRTLAARLRRAHGRQKPKSKQPPMTTIPKTKTECTVQDLPDDVRKTRRDMRSKYARLMEMRAAQKKANVQKKANTKTPPRAVKKLDFMI